MNSIEEVERKIDAEIILKTLEKYYKTKLSTEKSIKKKITMFRLFLEGYTLEESAKRVGLKPCSSFLSIKQSIKYLKWKFNN